MTAAAGKTRAGCRASAFRAKPVPDLDSRMDIDPRKDSASKKNLKARF
jgi:hypothetical protein